MSLRLDGELSQLEGALLDRHLEGCAACRAHAASLAGVTAGLRGAALERPDFQFALPRRRRSALGMTQIATAAAAAIAAIGLTSYVGQSGNRSAAQIDFSPATSLVTFESARGLPQFPRVAVIPRRGLRSLDF